MKRIGFLLSVLILFTGQYLIGTASPIDDDKVLTVAEGDSLNQWILGLALMMLGIIGMLVIADSVGDNGREVE